MRGRFVSSFGGRMVLLLLLDFLCIGAVCFCWLVLSLPQIPEDLESLHRQAGVNIYADGGELLYTFNRRVERVELDDVSPFLIQAVIATEDRDFYGHHGFSIPAILGAVVDNARHFRKVRGGSTITQQIVKNLFLTREKTFFRKIKEVLLAVQLESMFHQRFGPDAKVKLLELYLNGSFYGASAYGVEDAARTYFGKSSGELSLREAAMLAGLPNAPSALNPLGEDGERARTRTDHVLKRMATERFITQKQLTGALEQRVGLRSEREPKNRTPYFVETIKEEVARRWGRSALSFGGLNIHTTLDLKMQEAAERAISEGLMDLDARLGFSPYDDAPVGQRAEYVQAALLCLDPQTGYVKAMVGGRDIFVSYYNRATTAKRQPGSGFKPVLYLAAFASGKVTPLSLFVDEPRTYELNRRHWSPKNFQDSYLGLTTAAWALVKSANSTSVQVVQKVGPEQVVKMAKKLGIQSSLQPYASIALGTEEVTMLELASAYGSIANYGVRVEPSFIRSIDDLEGRGIYTHRVHPVPVLDPADASVMIGLLRKVVDMGTGHAVRSHGFKGPAAGKTGTTNDNTDAWFTGFIPGLVTSVWIGFDSREGNRALIEKRTRRQITGGGGAAPIWAAFMKAVAGPIPAEFWTPPGVTEVTVDARTGQEADSIEVDSSLFPIQIVLKNGVVPNSADQVAAFLSAQVDTAGP